MVKMSQSGSPTTDILTVFVTIFFALLAAPIIGGFATVAAQNSPGAAGVIYLLTMTVWAIIAILIILGPIKRLFFE